MADKHLFLDCEGRCINPYAIWAVVGKYAKGADLDKPVAPHRFCHTCATHMPRNGAPIRQLQEMLEHDSLELTQIYTHFAINDLRAMHRKFHPREQKQTIE